MTCASRVSELDAEAHIAQYVTVLAHLLLWAVQRACRRFASGNVTKAECPDWKRAYAPSTAHISPFTARCSGCGIAIGAWQPGLQAEEGQQRYTSRTTPHVTCVTRHAQNAKPTSRCRTVAPWSIPLHHGAPRCDGCYHPETNGVKASPHRHKRVLSHGKRRKASSVTRHGRHRTSPALHVTRKTRSRRLAVARLHWHLHH